MKKTAPKKAAPKTTAPPASKKSSTPRTSKPPKKAPKKSPAATEITNEQIAERAYYIGERRQNSGGEGDPSSDWIAAELELRSEAGLA
ncbi:MAG: DUF2934 domain-containing protein [Chthoniobacterales bacterium]